MYQPTAFSLLCEHNNAIIFKDNNATVKQVLSVGFPKQILVKKMWMFEATDILLAETRHMHQEMTFVLPVWKQECLCIVLVYKRF